ncbi:MAG: aspartate oxidase [Actinobacteria bacterium 13_1_20CM_3_68_9]|nr:MAG: aspartate oxidase [Actinobacteria bacterium 13_1_20CM_3_68_9]
MERPTETDVAVVGGGAAGLYVALRAAEPGAAVALVSRKPLAESASYWAQGGLAAALAPDDSPARHAEDTLNAGRGLCRTEAVATLTRQAPAAVQELRERGVRFDTEADGRLGLALEGGHSARRIVHAGGSRTGRAITGCLAELVAGERQVEVLEETSALALWSDGSRCAGVLTDAGPIAARATVLATGGGAALWQRTTNPWGAIGAGAVLAHAAGADLADLEFCQFHPTALALPGSDHDGTLLTEALRGEGATLLDAAGRRFTDELAPRDQVTEAILDRIEADHADHVGLDLRPLAAERFPNVFAACRAAGLDPEREPVPVAPAAHYLMGGIVCDLDARTSLPGLLAVGECACSGVHGANRLASNSLTECFVFGARAALAAASTPPSDAPVALPEWRFAPPAETTREAVWHRAGPRRNAAGLEPLLDDPYLLARLIARAALEREETRGAHRRTDNMPRDPALDGVHIVIGPDSQPRRERWS